MSASGWTGTHRLYVLVTALLACAFVSFMVYQYAVKMPQAISQERALALIFKSIGVPTLARCENCGVTHKASWASAFGYYSTSLSKSRVIDFYADRLREQGWQPCHTNEPNVLYYTHGNYEAMLELLAQDPTRYGFSISWGDRMCRG